MLLTPADRGSSAQARAARGSTSQTGAAWPRTERPGSADAWHAAPVAEVSAPSPSSAGWLAPAGLLTDTAIDLLAPQLRLADASVRAGGCFARPLPLDGTCASAARRLFREAVAGAGLPGDLVHDGVTMASELAANTLNAHGNIEFGGHGHRPVSGMPEFWLYVRAAASGREIVCKIFDSEPGWDAGEPLPVGAAVPAGPDSVRGRGLQLVAGLSAGHWGHHLTRGRLGAWKVQGKAVWFALRVPPDAELARCERIAPRGSRVISELVAALDDRGLGAGLVEVAEPGGDLAVLSVSQRLTVWCHGEIIWWREPDGNYDRLMSSDLVEAAERIVCSHEELTVGRQAGHPADADQQDSAEQYGAGENGAGQHGAGEHGADQGPAGDAASGPQA